MTAEEQLDNIYRQKYLKELSNIKNPGASDTCSKEEFEWRVREIAKCKRSINYFVEHWYKIVNLDKGLMTISLYPKQRELLDFLVEEKRCIVLAARQSGKTTIYVAYLLWLTQFFPEKKVMILANKADTALEILSRLRLAWEYLPSFLKNAVVIFNKSELVFSNLSGVKGFATASDAARGYSASVVVMDEAAFVPNNIASKVFESIYPVISSSKNSRFIMVSTPNGADPNNLYYEIWQKANSNSSAANVEGWKAFRFDWWDVPTRDEKWKEQTLASIGEQRFAQEFGNEFLASTTIKKLIPDDIIERYRIKQTEAKALDKDFFYGKKTQIVNEAQNKLYEFTMWHEFDPKKTYLASGDVAEGVGGDSSVLYVWDVTDLGNIIQCAKFDSNQVSPIEFAFVTVKVLALYNNPYYVCERNGIGSGYLDAMKITFQYQNFVLEGKNNDCGVFSHVTMKEKACVWAREMMTTAGFGWTFYDKDLVNEMSTFCRKDNKGVRLVYSAMPPAHDDHIMAWIWACWILNPEIVERYFVCCETFTSQLEKIYPKILQPLNEYKAEDIQNVVKDKLYKDFLDFKEEIQHRLGKAMTLEKQAEKNDQYFRSQRDPYFNDFDDSPNWNSSYSSSKLNSAVNFPKFYVF